MRSDLRHNHKLQYDLLPTEGPQRQSCQENCHASWSPAPAYNSDGFHQRSRGSSWPCYVPCFSWDTVVRDPGIHSRKSVYQCSPCCTDRFAHCVSIIAELASAQVLNSRLQIIGGRATTNDEDVHFYNTRAAVSSPTILRCSHMDVFCPESISSVVQRLDPGIEEVVVHPIHFFRL